MGALIPGRPWLALRAIIGRVLSNVFGDRLLRGGQRARVFHVMAAVLLFFFFLWFDSCRLRYTTAVVFILCLSCDSISRVYGPRRDRHWIICDRTGSPRLASVCFRIIMWASFVAAAAASTPVRHRIVRHIRHSGSSPAILPHSVSYYLSFLFTLKCFTYYIES